MTDGEFVLDEKTGIATLHSKVELFGLTIPLEFEFQKTEDGVALNFLNASIGDKVKAKLCFGDESDKPAIPETASGYQDILNSEITLDLSLKLITGLTDEATGKRDEVTLNGKVALCLKGGAVKEIRADFG